MKVKTFRLFGTLALLWICSVSFGQTILRIQIKDIETKEPISYCHIIEEGGKIRHVANTDGITNIELIKYPIDLTISHISYRDTVLRVTETTARTIQVFLSPLLVGIEEIEIKAGKLKIFFSNEKFYVTDFVFQENKLWVIGYTLFRVFHTRINY